MNGNFTKAKLKVCDSELITWT